MGSLTQVFISQANNLCRCADVRPSESATGCNNTARQSFHFDEPEVVSVYKINGNDEYILLIAQSITIIESLIL